MTEYPASVTEIRKLAPRPTSIECTLPAMLGCSPYDTPELRCVASLRYDPQGKAHAQMLMDFPIQAPKSWVTEGLVTVR